MIKKILILATGGTIAGSVENQASSSYQSSKILIEQIAVGLPEIKNAEISLEQFSQRSGQDVDDEFMIDLANRVFDVFEIEDIDCVVITHGTDSMEESAFFLNLTVKTNKPIVFTGAMRASNYLSSDGLMNLFNAIVVASSDAAYSKGVLVVANNQIYAARDFCKNHTFLTSAFDAPNFASIGFVNYYKVKFYYQSLQIHTFSSIFDIKQIIKTLPKIEIIYAHTGQDCNKVYEYLANSGFEGVVFSGFGNGNLSEGSLDLVGKLLAQNVLVARSSRVGRGCVIADIEINDSQIGLVVADNFNAQKSRILLALCLTKTKDFVQINQLFDSY